MVNEELTDFKTCIVSHGFFIGGLVGLIVVIISSLAIIPGYPRHDLAVCNLQNEPEPVDVHGHKQTEQEVEQLVVGRVEAACPHTPRPVKQSSEVGSIESVESIKRIGAREDSTEQPGSLSAGGQIHRTRQVQKDIERL